MARKFENTTAFLQSLSSELESQSDRIRNLIGDKHWLSDGFHKEYLLRSLLVRHLPDGIRATRGFVLDPLSNLACSREQDILITDCSKQGPIFNQGDVVIVFPSNVLGSVSVKTAYSTQALGNLFQGLFASPVLFQEPANVWFGGYFFEGRDADPRKLGSTIRTALAAQLPKSVKFGLNGLECCLRLGASEFTKIRFFTDRAEIDVYTSCPNATSIFVARLLDHVSSTLNAGRSDFADLVDDACGRITTHHRVVLSL